MTDIPFIKMEGAGNDFVVIDRSVFTAPLAPELLRAIADRRFGAGCDQILCFRRLPESEPGTDAPRFAYQIFNQDGSEAAQCGNGARCVGRCIFAHGLADGARRIKLCAMHGEVAVEIDEAGLVSADMGRAATDPERVPFVAAPEGLEAPESRRTGSLPEYRLEGPGFSCWYAPMGIGNPHASVFWESGGLDEAPLEAAARLLQSSPRFPEGVNVSFIEPPKRSGGDARIRTYERGAGETLACGTATSAAFMAGVLRGTFRADAPQGFQAQGGRLVCRLLGDGGVRLAGPAREVYRGVFFAREPQEAPLRAPS